MIKLNLKTPFFLFLLPVFFVLHGFMQNYDFVPVKDAILLTGMYMGFAVLFSLLFRLLFKDFTRANLVALFIMAFHFFFGSVHDFLKKAAPGSFAIKYSFIIPGIFVLLLVLVIFLKTRKKPLVKTARYLNVLFLVFIIADTAMLGIKIIRNKKEKIKSVPEGISACANCPKPDIYFIIADEYVGNSTLKEQFHFDNTGFTQELADRGFHTIPYSRSNYNYTPFSIASTFKMDYLNLEAAHKKLQPDLVLCYETIRDNDWLTFLLYHGYRLHNYSIFDFEGQPARTREAFLPAKTKLITSQTFISRFDKEVRYNFVTRWKSESELRRLTYNSLKNNNNIYNLTWKIAEEKLPDPKFIFTHLHLPHYPYYFDKDGKERPFETLLEGNQVNKELYIGYLQYGNRKYLELIDHILKYAEKPPVIILMGDHGFRHFPDSVEKKYTYLNHISIYLPGKNYASFTDSLTNVNFFRTMLNAEFSQHMPMLKDSVIFIKE